MAAGIKWIWTEERINFIRENWNEMTNQQLADALCIPITTVRIQCISMGLKRMELEYWTDEQIAFLVNNYQEMGDSELAEILNAVSPKSKQWTIKHIEKKRKYLKLNRTKEELKTIHRRNVENGCFTDCPRERWRRQGVMPEGTIRMWAPKGGRSVPYVKHKGVYVHWNRWAWQTHYGPIPEGMNVVFKDNDPANRVPENLELVTNAELGKRNSRNSSTDLSDNYVAGLLSFNAPEIREEIKKDKGLIEIKRQQILLKRTIRQHHDIAAD